MKELYAQYFENLISPEKNKGNNAINLTEGILLSWPFVIIKFLLDFLLTYFFLDQIAKNLILEGDFENLYNMFSTKSISSGYFLLFASSFVSMILFPLWAFFAYLFWKMILNFYFWALKIEDKNGKLTDEIVCAGFSGYIFYLVPVIGEVCTSLARLVVLFIAMRRRLDISALAAFFILLTPPLLIGLIILIFGIFIQILTIS